MFKERVRKLSSNTGIIAGLGAVVVVAVLGAIVARSNVSAANAWKLATTHQPERFTELYFNNSRLLPSPTLVRTTKTFSFHLTNHEARRVGYRYVVTETVGSVTTPVTAGGITLDANQGANQPVTFGIPSTAGTYTIAVQLTGYPEFITFRGRS